MGCMTCDSCQGCDQCQGVCNTVQNLCKLNGQLASDNVDIEVWEDKDTNSPFLKASEWNKFITSIYNAYKQGSNQYNGWGSKTIVSLDDFSIYTTLNMDIRAGKPTGKASGTEDFMYAGMFNGALKKMRYLSSRETGDDEVEVGDVIYADTFNELKQYALTKFKLHSKQCDRCNTACDVKCDSNQCNTPTFCCDDCSETIEG